MDFLRPVPVVRHRRVDVVLEFVEEADAGNDDIHVAVDA